MVRSSSGSERVIDIMDRSSLGSEGIGSELVITQDELMNARTRLEPTVISFNVTKSSHVHIGERYVSVTQNVEQMEVVNDFTFYRYVWHLVKKMTRVEKIICSTAMSILILCILLIIYFVVKAKSVKEDTVNLEPSEWLIKRLKWLSRNYNETEGINKTVPLVIISHTVGPNCYTFIDCGAVMRNLQSYYLDTLDYDIPYNFVIGNDGRVYEGMGWNVVGAHTYGYNYCSMGLAFTGDYREGLPSYTKVTELQLQRAHMLFEDGVKNGFLHTNFMVLGAKDLRSTLSPGANLYKAIQKWANYDHQHLLKGRSCSQIQEFFEKQNIVNDTINLLNKIVP